MEKDALKCTVLCVQLDIFSIVDECQLLISCLFMCK